MVQTRNNPIRVTMKALLFASRSTKFPSTAFGERSAVNLRSTIMMHCLYFTDKPSPSSGRYRGEGNKDGRRFQSRGMENIRPYASKGPPSCRDDQHRELAFIVTYNNATYTCRNATIYKHALLRLQHRDA